MLTSSPTGRAGRQPKRSTFGRHKNAMPCTLTLDPDARHLLAEMATGKTLGAFVSGLIRAEWSRQEQRRRLRRALEEGAAVDRS